MQKYDILFVLCLPEGSEVVLVRNLEVPIKEKIDFIKKECGGIKIHWTAFTQKGKKVIDSGTINDDKEEE